MQQLLFKIVAVLALGLVLVGGGFLYGKSYEQKAQLNRDNLALKEYIDKNEQLQTQVRELLARVPEKVEVVRIEYRENKDAIQKAVDSALSELRNNNRGLRVTVRELQAQAATANLSATTIGNYAERTAELSAEASEFFITEAGRADGVVAKLDSCQNYVLLVHELVDNYNATVAEFYKNNGYVKTFILPNNRYTWVTEPTPDRIMF